MPRANMKTLNVPRSPVKLQHLRVWALLLCGVTVLSGQDKPRTTVGIRGSVFTLNGHTTYTAEAGFPNANTNLAGTLLNVRAVEAIFDDANYPAARQPRTSVPCQTRWAR